MIDGDSLSIQENEEDYDILFSCGLRLWKNLLLSCHARVYKQVAVLIVQLITNLFLVIGGIGFVLDFDFEKLTTIRGRRSSNTTSGSD